MIVVETAGHLAFDGFHQLGSQGNFHIEKFLRDC